MQKSIIYLDTTVPSAYFDNRAPDRMNLTREFWKKRLQNFDCVISNIVISEIKDIPIESKRNKMENLVKKFKKLNYNEEAEILTQEYIKRGVFPEKYISDARHVALAVINRINYFLSWNYKHIVKIKTRREVNLINSLMGY